MADANRFVVSGRLTKDAEIKDAGGTKLVSGSIASNDYSKKGEHTNFFDFTIWGEFGQSIIKHLQKGKYVVMDGRLRHETFNRKDGTRGSSYKLAVDKVAFGPSRSQDTGEPPTFAGDDIPF